MGHRTTQRILECSECGIIPEDGEYMWEMCGAYMCEKCADTDTPELIEGTRDSLDKLTIRSE